MSEMQTLAGAAASPGIGKGPAYVVTSEDPAIPEVDDAGAAFMAAATTASEQLTELAAGAENAGLDEAAEILKAQAMMAADPTLADEVAAGVASGLAMEPALDAAAGAIADSLRDSGSEYLAERAADVGEIARRIRFALAGVVPSGLDGMTVPGIVVARSLTAADTAGMDPNLVSGFVTEEGGPTGHVSVIARALRIPAAVAVSGATDAISPEDDVIVDGGTGDVVVRPDDETRRTYAALAADLERRIEAAQKFRGASVGHGDRRIAVAANVGGHEDIAAAVEEAADGVGLFRTEFLFLDRSVPPSEDEQLAVYQHALESFAEPVVIRTFDIGGDKPATYLDMDEEDNPFLGVRGMRLYEAEQELAMTQARSLLRAAATGELWVMAPMVATVADAAAMRDLFTAAGSELDAEGIEHGGIKLGAMIEVPAAALNAGAIAQHVDFFSIGTNDLTQYALAVDRTSATLAGYLDAAEPAVLKLCAMTAAAGDDVGISVSVCGEAGADPGLAILFAAMGMDKLSVAAPAVNLIKQTIAEADPASSAALLASCLAAASAQEVRGLLAAAATD